MVLIDGHWVFWHWIVESLRHEHDVHTSGYQTSPGTWPWKIYFRFIVALGNSLRLLAHLIVAGHALGFSQALAVVLDRAFRTEAAFLQRCTANRPELGEIRWIFQRCRRLNPFLPLLDGLARLTAAARIVDERSGAVRVKEKCGIEFENRQQATEMSFHGRRSGDSPIHCAETILSPVDADAVAGALASISGDRLA